MVNEMEHHEDDLTFEEQDEYDRDNGLGLYARPLIGGPAEDYSRYYAPYDGDDEDEESELFDNSDVSVLEDELRRQVQQSDVM